MAERVYRYDVFLSHSSRDKDFVRALDRRLRAVGIKTFFDEAEIPWGANIPAVVERALDESRHLILVLSPDAVESEWVDLERYVSIFRSPAGRERPVLPLLRRDCESIPPSVRLLRHLCVRDDREFDDAWPRIVEHVRGATIEERRSQTTAGGATWEMTAQPEKRNIIVMCPIFGASRIYYTELLAAISDKASKYKYGLSIVPIPDITRKRPLVSYFPQLSSAAGVILITCQVDGSTWLDECASLGLPVVLLHDNIPEDQAKGHTVVSYIWPGLDALSELVSHLVDDHNCKNLSVVMVSPKDHAIRTQKLRTIQQAIKKHELDFDPDRHLYSIKEYSHTEGMRIADEILEKNPESDAIVCLADITAIGILQRLEQLEPTNRIRLTGFDNVEVSAYSDLTTVDQQLRLTGERALIDLHNAIQHGSCLEFRSPSCIATSLVRRGSCCFGSKLTSCNGVKPCRRAVFCLVTHPTVSTFVRSFRQRVCALDMREFDTTKLVGSAAQYPDHVTLVGTFLLEDEAGLSQMCDEISCAVRRFQPFVATTGELQRFPGGTLSIGFTEESRARFLELQETMLPIVKQYRRGAIEPEFREYLYSRHSLEVDHTREFGEPFVLELYKPHITLVSGLRNQDDYEELRQLAQDTGSGETSGLRLTVSELWLMEEEEIGGNWRAVRPFEL